MTDSTNVTAACQPYVTNCTYCRGLGFSDESDTYGDPNRPCGWCNEASEVAS